MTAGLNPDYVQELFTAFGPVSVRRMFSGAGVFADGLMIAIVNDGAIFLKAGPDGGAAFEREGCQPFHFAKKSGQVQLTSYWRMPDRLYDDPDELALWARAALAAAQTKASQKRRAAHPAKARRKT